MRSKPSGRRGGLGRDRAARPRVEILRGVRDELLVVVNGHLASLAHAETLAALKAAGLPVVRTLSETLEDGSTEARATAAWLLGGIRSPAAIPVLRRLIEGARWRGETPVVLRRASEALVRLGESGVVAFARAIEALAASDLTRLLLIRHAAAELAGAAPAPPIPNQIARAWARALEVYGRRLEQLDQIREADRRSFQRLVLEAYGVSIEQDRRIVPRLIEALRRQPLRVSDIGPA